MNGLHPIQPGAMDLKNQRNVMENVCACGKCDLTYIITRATPEEVEEDVKRH